MKIGIFSAIALLATLASAVGTGKESQLDKITVAGTEVAANAWFVSAEEMLDGQAWLQADGVRSCGSQPVPQPNACQCKKGQLLLGQRTGVAPNFSQTWYCVDVEVNEEIQCRSWDGFCGFCMSNKVLNRPLCQVPLAIFDALDVAEIFDAYQITRYLTFDRNGWSYIDQTAPLSYCPGACCRNYNTTCLRRGLTFSFNMQSPISL